MKILVLDLDTLRPDHLGCYGYGRNTSPNIDWIAAQGVRYNKYYCSDAPCLPSRAGLMTGRFGIHTGVVGHGGTAADMRLEGAGRMFLDSCSKYNLPAVLRNYGFTTTLISPFPERHGAYWFYAGFQEIHNTGECGQESAERITPIVLKWIEENAEKDNWYLHINYWDAHTPYRAPESFGNPFAEEPVPGKEWMNEERLHEHMKAVGPHTALDLNMFDDRVNPRYPRQLGKITNMKEWKANIDAYDCGIRYMDGHIGMILEELKKHGSLDDVAIIVTSDHGENMGELAIYSEHATADEATCHIPMIIKWPGCRIGGTDEGMRYQLDLLPTLLELLEDGDAGKKEFLESVKARLDGRSYAKSLFEENMPGREYLVLSQCAHVCQRSVRFEDWLYMRTYHDGYHLFDEDMLFRLSEDPGECENVAEKYPEICYQGAYYLEQWSAIKMLAMV